MLAIFTDHRKCRTLHPPRSDTPPTSPRSMPGPVAQGSIPCLGFRAISSVWLERSAHNAQWKCGSSAWTPSTLQPINHSPLSMSNRVVPSSSLGWPTRQIDSLPSESNQRSQVSRVGLGLALCSQGCPKRQCIAANQVKRVWQDLATQSGKLGSDLLQLIEREETEKRDSLARLRARGS